MADYIEELFLKFARDPEALTEELREVKITPTDLLRNQAEHSELYLKWARLATKAKSEYQKQDRWINHAVYPEAREKARQTLRELNEKETEKRIDEMAYKDPLLISAIEVRADLEALWDTFKNAEEAFQHRLQNLKSMSFRQGKELDTLG